MNAKQRRKAKRAKIRTEMKKLEAALLAGGASPADIAESIRTAKALYSVK